MATDIDKVKAVGAKLQACRATLQGLLGDGYDASAEPWREMVRGRMRREGERVMQATLALMKLAAERADGTAIMWIGAAACDLCGEVAPSEQ